MGTRQLATIAAARLTPTTDAVGAISTSATDAPPLYATNARIAREIASMRKRRGRKTAPKLRARDAARFCPGPHGPTTFTTAAKRNDGVGVMETECHSRNKCYLLS